MIHEHVQLQKAVRFGHGSVKISVGRSGDSPAIGFDSQLPQKLGPMLSGKNVGPSEVLFVFENQESLDVLQLAVDAARALFPKLETPAEPKKLAKPKAKKRKKAK